MWTFLIISQNVAKNSLSFNWSRWSYWQENYWHPTKVLLFLVQVANIVVKLTFALKFWNSRNSIHSTINSYGFDNSVKFNSLNHFNFQKEQLSLCKIWKRVKWSKCRRQLLACSHRNEKTLVFLWNQSELVVFWLFFMKKKQKKLTHFGFKKTNEFFSCHENCKNELKAFKTQKPIHFLSFLTNT